MKGYRVITSGVNMEKDILIGLVVVVLFIWFYRKLNTKSADKLSRKPRELVTNNESAVIRKKSQHLGSQKASLGFDINKPVTDSANPAAGISEALQEFNLLMMKDLSPAQHQATLQMLSYYKKPHPLLSKLTKGHLDQKDLLELIKSDAKITAKILFIVNSARFSVQQPIKDINHAIMFLGVSVVRGIAIEFALKHSFEFKDDNSSCLKLTTMRGLFSSVNFILSLISFLF